MTLRQARKKRRLTQDQLAALSGVTQTAISKIELGTVPNPTWETVSKLCTALQMEPSKLFPIEQRESA